MSLGGDSLAIHAGGALTNAAGTTATGAQGGVIGGNGSAQLTADTIANHGQISGAGDASVSATTLNNDAGSLTAGGTLTATVAGPEQPPGHALRRHAERVGRLAR
ncbi:hypothetical protein AU476_36350 [Cupriavidus sp. UYMSc13B]|nr:hypothetical protein AU476_36350 [Cupriavidus sp. UYMSc13B]